MKTIEQISALAELRELQKKLLPSKWGACGLIRPDGSMDYGSYRMEPAQ